MAQADTQQAPKTSPTRAQLLADFDVLPDLARVGWPEACALYGVSKMTLLRRIKARTMPEPIREAGTTRFVVGHLRAHLSNSNGANC